MGRFEKYFLMGEGDVAAYMKEKYQLFEPDGELKVEEIGDGNLNYVFRIQDRNTGFSVILKHSGVETRAKSGRHVDTDRNRIEAEALGLQSRLAPGYVPEIYGYDPVMCCTAMEDLKGYDVMRKALLEYKAFPFFAEQITSYMADILVPTTDVSMDHKEKKRLVGSYINPDLCAITEQLVYTEPFGNFSGKNMVGDGLESFVEAEIYQDHRLRLEAAKLKFGFMEHAQALLHGDLHSGSIFINEKQLKVFDPEFAFYGPMGYDLANVIAHVIFAKFHSLAVQEEGQEKERFQEWTDQVIMDCVDLFSKKFIGKLKATCQDPMAQTNGFGEHYLSGVLEDGAGMVGCELIRRIVGVAKVEDLTGILDSRLRGEIEKKLLLTGKEFIFNRGSLKDGKAFLDVAKKHA